MANIPRYVSKENPTAEAPAAIKSDNAPVRYADASDSNMAQTAQMGKQIQEIGERLTKITNANDFAKAEFESTGALFAHEEAFNKEPDKINAFKRVDSDLQKIGDAASKNFHNSAAKAEWVNKWNMKTLVYKNALEGKVMKEQIDIGRTNILTGMDLQLSAYINAPDEASKAKAREQIEATMKLGVDNLLFTHEEGIKEVERVIKTGDEVLEDNKKLKVRKEKEFALAQKSARNQTEQEYVKMKVNGKDKNGVPVTREELIKMVRNDMNAEVPRVTPKFAELYINALTSPKAVKAKTIDIDFANAISDINKGKSPDLIRKNMLKDLSDGYLSEQDFAAASTYLDMLIDKSPEDLTGQQIRKAWFGLGGPIYSADKDKQAESRARMSRSFINKLQNGIDPQLASLEVTREEVLYLQPKAINYPNGMEVMDAHGVRKLVMPNGDVVVAPENKKGTPKK